jgi:chromosome segregation ATPase
MNAGTSVFLIFLLLFGSFSVAGASLVALDETKEDLQQAREQVGQLEQQILDLETRLSKITQDLQAANNELAQAATERDAALSNVNELTQALHASQAQERAQAEKMASLEAERNRWQTRAMKAEADLQAAVSKQNSYVKTLLQLNSQKQAAQDELASLKQTCNPTALVPQAQGLLPGEFKELAPGLTLTLPIILVLVVFTINRLGITHKVGNTRRT